MREAVGYDQIGCEGGASVENAMVLKNDRLFVLLNELGNIAPPGHCGLGYFLDDTRMLSEYRVSMAGGEPVALSSQVMRTFSAQVDLAVTDKEFGGDSRNVVNGVHVRRELLLDDRLVECLSLTNFLGAPVDFWLELHFGCDFADIFEVRGWKRSERGQFYRSLVADTSVRFAYRGRDGQLIRSAITFTRAPDVLDARHARWNLRLEPHVPLTLEWEVLTDANLKDEKEPAAPRSGGVGLEQRRSRINTEHDEWRAGCAAYRVSDDHFRAAIEQSVTDLHALYTSVDGDQIISAGIPWYSTAFGRDSIITSLQTLGLNPGIAVDTLRYLAARQGTREDDYTEEQPGKIMHEIRRGELARAREIPHLPYYGTIDATPLWLILLHETWRWTGDMSLIRELLPCARAALDWMDKYGDLDGDGFVEYASKSPRGLVNQGWKDSWDGIPYPDGAIPDPPIALVEVQGYVYDAKRRMSAVFGALGDSARCTGLREDAERMRQRIVDHFWMEDAGTFALALDGKKRPLRTIASNAAHLLWSRVPDATQAARMAQVLTGSSMFSGWGMRTLGAEQPVFNPMSYHNGTIWPHDNGLATLGLALYSQQEAATRIFSAMRDAAAGMRYARLPELFCGMPRARGMHPVLYPVSCIPQAWASGAVFMLLQSAIGILPDAPSHALHIRRPWLPEFLNELVVRNLRIGESRVALQFSRHGSRTLANLLDIQGAPLRVTIELA
jgi:glycogen debranching enzyme